MHGQDALGGVVPHGGHRVVATLEVVKDVDGGGALEVYICVREGCGKLSVGPVVVDGVEGVCVVVRVAEDGQVVGLERTEGIRLRTGRDERWARHRTSYVYSSDKHIRVHIYFRCCCVRRPVPRPCRRTAPRRGGGRSGGRRWWSKSTGPCSTRRRGRGSRRRRRCCLVEGDLGVSTILGDDLDLGLLPLLRRWTGHRRHLLAWVALPRPLALQRL